MRDTCPWKYEPTQQSGGVQVRSLAIRSADPSAWPFVIWAKSPPWALGESVALACREDVADTIVKAVNAYRGWGEMPKATVQAMLDAFNDSKTDSEGHLPSMSLRMERALRVALDAMDYAMCQAHEQYLPPPVKQLFDKVWLNGFIASVVSRLLHPKPKPVEERVIIRPAEGPAPRLYVDLDGITQYSFASEVDAEIYRLGLIAKLKAESEKSA